MFWARLAITAAVVAHLGAAHAAAPPNAVTQSRLTIAAALDLIVQDAKLRKAALGAYVQRLDDGLELYAHDANAQLVPASNIKIVTTAAALQIMSPDYQYPTDLLGQVNNNGQVAGDLTIKGYGDPYLLPERVWYLANRLYFMGIRDITGDIVVDDTYFDGPRMAVGSEEDRTASAYMAPAGALSVGFNALLVHVLPNSQVNGDARIMLDPASNYAAVEGKVRTVAQGRSSVNVDVVAKGERSVVRVSGRIRGDDPGRGYWRRIDNPPVFAGEVLRATLNQVGIKVRGKVRAGIASLNAPKLLTATSPRLAELLGPLNKYSNNFMAAQLAYTAGAKRYGSPGSWDKGRRAIEEFLTDSVKLPAGGYTLRNASGLHEVNRMSPRQMVQVLAYMHGKPQYFPEYITSLAVAAGSGTLQDRMENTPAAHLLRAKTGTLAGASALSGYVTTQSGETLAFSFIVNGFQTLDAVLDAENRFGATLAALSFDPETDVAKVQVPTAVVTGSATP